ncbi:MAG TPA: sulfatase [bacterium]|nr:sulfatase [bacterium]
MKKTMLKMGAAMAALGLALGAAFGAGCWNKARKPPVVLVIIDTLPASHAGCYGYPRSTTPNLDKVAHDGVRFAHAIAAAPWTLPSIASILTGTLPSRHRAGLSLDPWTMDDRRLEPMQPGIVTLAELFRDHGYQTAAFFNNPFTDPGFGLDRGYDLYDYVPGDNLAIRPAPQVVADATTWIQDHGQKPFFITVHLFDPHLAYSPPLGYAMPYISNYGGELKLPFNPDLKAVRQGRVAYNDADKEFIKGLYDGEVAATDSALGRLIAFLKQKDLYDTSLIVITADHGEEFWEHGGFEHGHTMHRELLAVPLVIKFPGINQAGKTVDQMVSLMDIMPTIAEEMEWPLPFTVDGVSLYPRGGKLTVPTHIIVAENVQYGPQQQCFYADNYKLIVNRDTAGITVYDLASDPAETRDVFGQAKLPESVKNQVQHIAADINNLLQSQKPEAANLDQDTINKLKSLGYLSN